MSQTVTKKISESNYKQYADGSEFDYADVLGVGNDSFMRMPHHWYKGVNDFKNEKKFIFWSSLETQPLSTATRRNRHTLSEITYQSNAAIMVENITVNDSTLESPNVIQATPNHNIYRIDVDGMKQVRWPGLNNATIGACFLNAEGVIIGKHTVLTGTPPKYSYMCM